MLNLTSRFNRLYPEAEKRRDEIFWGEIAPAEHLVEFYGDDEAFLDSLEGFITGGLRNGESVIVIATPEHTRALEIRLNKFWVDASQMQEQFISADAQETLSKFMVNGRPDEHLFTQVVTELLRRARKNGRQVRAFGEMVALLWANGHNGATVQLEHLWHRFCKSESFSLFCAYPKSGFTQDAAESIKEICAAHSKIVDGINWQLPPK